MGTGRKSEAKLAARQKAQPSESKSQGGHVQHKPGSQNRKKG